VNILVTDGSSRAALAITRSLGQKGHVVFVGEKHKPSLASCSRFCRAAIRYPDPKHNSAAFLDAIVAIVERYEIDLLLPVTDVCVLPISEHRERFAHAAIIPLPDHEALKLAADKRRLTELAASLGIPVPNSTILTNGNATSQTEGLGLPVVIKPSRSRIPVDSGWIPTSVDYAFSASELAAKIEALHPGAFPVVLQERVKGPGIGLFYCYDNGQCIASFAHRRLREKPPSGGVSVMRESVALHPEADRFSRLLLDRLRWHGVAMVEFKLDERDQMPKLMEINGRFWGSLQLAIDAGVDFPALLTAVSMREPVTPVTDFQVGVRSRWLWGEMDLLLMFLSKTTSELKLPQDHPSRLRSILQILNPFYRDQHLEILRLQDLKPWLHEGACWFKGG